MSHNKQYPVQFIKYQSDDGDITYRGILYNIDEATGAKSIIDIVETDAPESLANIFAGKLNYDENSVDFYFFDSLPDFGRAKKLSTKFLKIINSMPVTR